MIESYSIMSKPAKAEIISYSGHNLIKAYPNMGIPEYIAMKDAREVACSALYPGDGEVVRSRVYPSHVAPIFPVPTGDTPTAVAMFQSLTRTYENKLKVYDELTRKQNNAKLGIYNLIWFTLSEESRDVLSRDPTWDNISSSRDVIALLALIDSTHAAGCSSANPLHRYNNAMDQFDSFAINIGETISSYASRLSMVISNLAVNNVSRVISDNEKAWKFFRGLKKSPHYAPFITFIDLETASTPNYFESMTYAKMKEALTKINLPDTTTSKGNRSAFYSNNSGPSKPAVQNKKKNVPCACDAYAKNPGKSYNGSKADTASKVYEDLDGPQYDGKDKIHAENPNKTWVKPRPDRGAANKSGSRPTNAMANDRNKSKPAVRLAKAEDYKEVMKASVDSDIDMYMDKSINYLLYLDSGANASIVHPNLLSNIRDADQPISVTGINGKPITLDKVGDLYGFFTVYSSDQLSGNIISYAEVASHFDIEYIHGVGFMVHYDDGVLLFENKNNLFVADFSAWSTILPHPNVRTANYACTVKSLEAEYTKSEVARARSAYELAANAGFITLDAAMTMINSGDITDVNITSKDMIRGFDIYGNNSYTLRGRTQNKKPEKAYSDNSISTIKGNQTFHCDVFYISNQMFLISVLNPFGLCLVSKIDHKSGESIGMEIVSQVDLVRSHGYNVEKVYCDADSTFNILKGRLNGIAIDIAGAGDHMPRADERIKCLKKIYRSVLSSLSFSLPAKLIHPLVIYCCKRLNMIRGTRPEPPAVTMYGFKPSMKREFGLAFGDPVEAKRPNAVSNDATDARTELCMALYPSGNINGSWVLYNLSTGKLVIRSNWIKLNVNQLFIDYLNREAVTDGSVTLNFETATPNVVPTNSNII